MVCPLGVRPGLPSQLHHMVRAVQQGVHLGSCLAADQILKPAPLLLDGLGLCAIRLLPRQDNDGILALGKTT